MATVKEVSLHQSINEMYERTREKGITTVFDRWDTQQPQCGFGLQGICCQLCSHGPCRITHKAQAGICGATADTIVARNWLRLATHGASSYSHHLEVAAKTLKATGQGKNSFSIQDEKKLRDLAGALNLDGKVTPKDLAVKVADALLYEIRKGAEQTFQLTQAFAPKPRLETWEKLGILGGGINSEVRDCMVRTSTSIDTDPVDLLLKSLRLSISANYTCLGLEWVQDILFGSPGIVQAEADLGILDPEYVNIVAHGHEPFVGMAVIQLANTPKCQELAKKAGAKGIKVYGSMCTGQELMQRAGNGSKGFAGQLGNWIAQEFWVATGAVDLVLMDMNCSIPGLQAVAEKFHTQLVPVSNIVRMAKSSPALEYDPERVDWQAGELIDWAIEAYKKRGSEIKIPAQKSSAIVGTGVESVLGVLGGSLDPLLGVIKQGAIRGIAAVVGCTTTKTGHDNLTVRISEELIKRDILVVNSGCASSATQAEGLLLPQAAERAGDGLKAVCKQLGIPPCLSFGTCTDISRIALVVTAVANALGVDVPALPVAASAPEYLEQKAVVYGTFAVAFGLFLHVAPIPQVTGGPLVTQILTQDVEGLTGGKVVPEMDPVKAAALIAAHIDSKRKALGLN